MRARLQKMRIVENGEEFIKTCVVNEVCLGGEYTMCGLAIHDNVIDKYGASFVGEGDEFEGSLKECDCPNCLKIINFCKSLK